MSFSHDQFFQRIFSHREHVASFLQGVLDPAELDALDLLHLSRLPETQVSPRLRKQLLFTMKWTREGLPHHTLVHQFAAFPADRPLRELDALISYIGEKGELNASDLDSMAEKRPPAERKKIMTLKQHLMELGRAEGKAEGLLEAQHQNARKMREHGIPLEVICEITGLTPEQVAAI